MNEQEPLPNLEHYVLQTGYSRKYGEAAISSEVSIDYPPEYEQA